MKINKNRRKNNEELNRLNKNFNALTIKHKKFVLKTAQGHLRIQRECKEARDSGHPAFSGQ
jgi:hypothetical protein